MKEIQGKRFGRLMVIERVTVQGANNAMWKCRCDCGNETVAAAANIGRTTFSCGCLAKEKAAETLRGNSNNRTHGLTGTPEYQAWTKMKLRCYDPNNHRYYTYGARGIAVCDQWRDSFETFFADVGPRPSPKHSIDRIDHNGDYTPNNCKWSTATQQNRNTTRNVFIEIDGAKKCVSEWCEHLGITKAKVYDQVGTRKGYIKPFKTVEAAIRHFYRQKHP